MSSGPEGPARGKRTALAIFALSLVIFAAAAFLWRDRIAARWWVHKLETGSPVEQRVALARLGELRIPAAAAALARHIEENGKTLDPAVVKFDDRGPVLATRTRHSRRGERGLVVSEEVEGRYSLDPAAEVLLEIGRPAVPALVRLLESPGWYAPAQALHVLGELGPASREALPALRALRRRCAERYDGLAPAVTAAIEKIEAGSTRARRRAP